MKIDRIIAMMIKSRITRLHFDWVGVVEQKIAENLTLDNIILLI